MAKQSGRGFAGMDDDKQRDSASKGGQSVPEEKRSFTQDRELAAEAGRKGGKSSQGGQQSASDSHQSQQGSHRGGRAGRSGSDEKSSEAGRKGGQR